MTQESLETAGRIELFQVCSVPCFVFYNFLFPILNVAPCFARLNLFAFLDLPSINDSLT